MIIYAAASEGYFETRGEIPYLESRRCGVFDCRSTTMTDRKEHFSEIYDLVRSIPAGRVMSYGQVGELAGCSARVVGWAMANVPDEDIPWQRVVGSDGYLRIGRRSPELQAAQRALLEREGVRFKSNECVDMDRCRIDDYTPENAEI